MSISVTAFRLHYLWEFGVLQHTSHCKEGAWQGRRRASSGRSFCLSARETVNPRDSHCVPSGDSAGRGCGCGRPGCLVQVLAGLWDPLHCPRSPLHARENTHRSFPLDLKTLLERLAFSLGIWELSMPSRVTHKAVSGPSSQSALKKHRQETGCARVGLATSLYRTAQGLYSMPRSRLR